MKKVIKYVAILFIVASMAFISAKPTYSPFFHSIEELEKDVHERFGVEGNTWGDGSTSTGNNTGTSQTPAQPEKKVVKTCDHTYEAKVTKEATCSEEGEIVNTCSKCGDSYKMKVDATGKHEYESTVTKEATCTEKGELTYKCTTCEDSYIEETDALGHSYESKVTKPASCLVPGEQEYKCSVCGDTYTEEIAALGHVKGDYVVTKEAGLFTEGEKVAKCATCGEILETEVINSQYPITYLYIMIAAAVALAVIIIGVVLNKRKI